jgi:hypothetical protein
MGIPRSNLSCVLFVLCASLLGGCKKKPEAAAQVEEEKAALPPEETAKIEAQLIAPPTAKVNAPIQERLQGAIHAELTMRLNMFVEKYGRMPEGLYEFSNMAMDSMPAAPPGMKYVIDPADRTVKAVRK